jgi:hypothetical protein
MFPPRVGLFTLGWWVLVVGLQVLVAPQVTPRVDTLPGWIWTGAMWAGWSAAVWMLAAAPLHVGRILLLGLALAWHALWMESVRDLPVQRYLFMLGVFAVIQALLASAIHLPRWSLWRPAQGSTRVESRQFGLLAVMVLLTVAALIAAAARQYESPAWFFYGSILVHFLMACQAVLAMATFLTARGGATVALAAATAGLALLGTAALALMEAMELGSFRLALHLTGPIYLTIQGTLVALVALLALCGRLDQGLRARP